MMLFNVELPSLVKPFGPDQRKLVVVPVGKDWYVAYIRNDCPSQTGLLLMI